MNYSIKMGVEALFNKVTYITLIFRCVREIQVQLFGKKIIDIHLDS